MALLFVNIFYTSVFNIEASDSCSNDYVEVRHINAMGSLLGRWCGSSTPATLTVANFLWIKFHSDSDITGVGFRGEWNSGKYDKLISTVHLSNSECHCVTPTPH